MRERAKFKIGLHAVVRYGDGSFGWGTIASRVGASLRLKGGTGDGRWTHPVVRCAALYTDKEAAEAAYRRCKAAFEERTEVLRAAHDHYAVVVADALKGAEE